MLRKCIDVAGHRKDKGIDEDGIYNEFHRESGNGGIPIKDSKSLIPSEPEVPKA